uniref:MFS transporter n=1 Tax=Eubacterium cellulosolvens TaxID=29322 RepID=UPI0004873085|nr:MFS transporter [[Eubacterium] cellulosolvens]
MSDSAAATPNKKLEGKNVLFVVSLCFFAVNIVIQMHGNVVPLSFQREFGLSEWMIGTITGAVNLMVSLVLLLTNRFRPGFAAVSILLALAGGSVLLLSRAETGHVLYAFVASFFFGAVCTNVAKVSATKLIVVGGSQERKSSSMAVVKTMEVLGGFFCLVLIYVFSGSAMFYIMSAIVLLFSLFTLIWTRRVVRDEAGYGNVRDQNSILRVLRECPDKIIILLAVWCWYIGYEAMMTTFSRYAVNVWHMEGNSYTVCLIVCMISATVFYIPAAKIFRGKPVRGIMIGLLMIAAGMFLISRSQSYHLFLNILFVMSGVGWSCIAVNGVVVTVSDVGDAHAGRLASLYYVVSSLSKILAPVISGAILERLHYRALYAILSIFFLFAIALLLVGRRMRCAAPVA